MCWKQVVCLRDIAILTQSIFHITCTKKDNLVSYIIAIILGSHRGCTVRLDHLHHKRKGEDNIIPNTFYSAKMLWEIETRNGMET